MLYQSALALICAACASRAANITDGKRYAQHHVPAVRSLPFGESDLEKQLQPPQVQYIQKRDPEFFDNIRIADGLVSELERKSIQFGNSGKRNVDDRPNRIVLTPKQSKPTPNFASFEAQQGGGQQTPQQGGQQASQQGGGQQVDPGAAPVPFEQQVPEFPGQQQQQQMESPPQPVAPFADGDPRDYVDMVPKWLACLNTPKKQQAFCTGCCVYRNTAGNPGNGVRGQCGFKDGVDSHPCFIPQEDVPGSGENLCFAHLTFSEADQACKHVCHFGKCGPGGSFGFQFSLRNDGNPNNVRSDHAPNLEFYSA
jgi:hypothetical protein